MAITDAQDLAHKDGLGLLEALRRTEGVQGLALARSLSALSGLPILEQVDLERVDVELVRKLPLSLAREQSVLPLYEDDGAVLVAVGRLDALSALDDLRLLLERRCAF